MRSILSSVSGEGTVVIGEGEKDGAPMLYNGERLGTGERPRFDIAVDPLEGTKACAAGLGGALSTIALASPGSLWHPGSSFYMEKLVVAPPASGAIDITRPPAENAASVADALGKSIRELRIVVLDKPRHRGLIDGLPGLGAHVRTQPGPEGPATHWGARIRLGYAAPWTPTRPYACSQAKGGGWPGDTVVMVEGPGPRGVSPGLAILTRCPRRGDGRLIPRTSRSR
jgi:hypothetical protein